MISGPVINIKDFGAVGDGVTDDTSAWTAFIAKCVSDDVEGCLPSGTYLIDPFTFNSSMAGLRLVGPTYNPMHPSFGLTPAILKRRGSTGTFLTFSAGWNTSFQFLEIDGAYTSDAVIEFTGGAGANSFNQLFENCSIYGATPTTGVVLDFVGTIQSDSTTFNRCNIHGYGAYDFSQYALSLIRNVNSNAFLINFNECYFANALKMFDFGAGSCSFNGCQFFRAQNYFFYVRSITQPFYIYECYTEQATGIPFFTQAGTAGVSSNYPISIESCIINDTNSMALNCQQPVRIIGMQTSGNITIIPMATYGLFPIYAEGVHFSGGADFIGSYTGYLTKIAGSVSNVGSQELHTKGTVFPLSTLAFAGNVVTDAKLANSFTLNVTTGTAFVMDAPTSGIDGQIITIRIFNSSGGALGVITWAAGWQLAGAFTNPASGKNRAITFSREGGVWYEQYRTAADVSN